MSSPSPQVLAMALLLLLLAATSYVTALNLHGVGTPEGLGSGLNTRSMTSWDINLWPRKDRVPTVHYKFGDETVDHDAVLAGMATIEKDTCIRFKKVQSFLYFGSHLIIRNSERTCSLHVGRKWMNLFGQNLYLTKICAANPGTVLRQLVRAIGKNPEENRYDRTDHIHVMYRNIQTGHYINFIRWFYRTFGVPYDFYSILQSGPLASSRNGKTTLYAKDLQMQSLMAVERTQLSFMDRLLINTAYKCTEDWLEDCNEGSNPCQNMGYLNATCSCDCPDGTLGDTCQNKTMSYNDALLATLSPLTETLDVNATVSTTDYPTPQDAEVVFTKTFTSAGHTEINITFEGFNLSPRCADDSCCEEGLEVHLSNQRPPQGTWYCGNEIPTGTTLSANGTLILFYMKADSPGNTYKGFNANVTFV
uniref:Metalloendopeptidase n=1 Tax=Hirondellea gigas TaxID=1518452 RepID=A0A6A7FV31_9CRUS